MATSSNCCISADGLRQDCCYNMQQSVRTKLDAALHELGMLSTITNSRHEYLKEIHHPKGSNIKIQAHSFNDSSPHIIQMNSDFITNFTFSPIVTNNGSSLEHQLPTSSSAYVPDGIGEHSFICKVRSSKTRHLYRPYDFPWRPKLIKSLLQEAEKTTLSHSMKDDVAAASPTLPIVTRQDSGGNKSNPGSPVKSQKPITGSGCSIVRSRSLDDLEISKLSLTECCSNEAGKTEIDTVSQWINNLHVT